MNSVLNFNHLRIHLSSFHHFLAGIWSSHKRNCLKSWVICISIRCFRYSSKEMSHLFMLEMQWSTIVKSISLWMKCLLSLIRWRLNISSIVRHWMRRKSPCLEFMISVCGVILKELFKIWWSTKIHSCLINSRLLLTCVRMRVKSCTN